MTKQDIKDLCEHDDKLQWWAMVLFAEVCELADCCKNGNCDHETAGRMIVGKSTEWDQIVIGRSLEIARKAFADAEKQKEEQSSSLDATAEIG